MEKFWSVEVGQSSGGRSDRPSLLLPSDLRALLCENGSAYWIGHWRVWVWPSSKISPLRRDFQYRVTPSIPPSRLNPLVAMVIFPAPGESWGGGGGWREGHYTHMQQVDMWLLLFCVGASVFFGGGVLFFPRCSIWRMGFCCVVR